MPPRRNASRSKATTSTQQTVSSSPFLNACLLVAALGYGILILIDRRAVSWPPQELITGLYTLAGCIAMVGPLVLWTRTEADGALGEFVWMAGGLLIWIFDLLALAAVRSPISSWATPLEPSLLGPIALAILLAGWKTGRSIGGWTWSNVTGWLLGVIWIGIAGWSLVPPETVQRLWS